MTAVLERMQGLDMAGGMPFATMLSRCALQHPSYSELDMYAVMLIRASYG